jgi:hypothetical protein
MMHHNAFSSSSTDNDQNGIKSFSIDDILGHRSKKKSHSPNLYCHRSPEKTTQIESHSLKREEVSHQLSHQFDERLSSGHHTSPLSPLFHHHLLFSRHQSVHQSIHQGKMKVLVMVSDV